jgi:hypothetical protein
MIKRTCAAILAMIAWLGSSSCSLLWIRPAPESDSRNSPPDCRSYVWPFLDLVLTGAVFSLNGFEGYCSAEAGSYCTPRDKTLGYVVGSMFAASFVYGMVANTVCHKQLARPPNQTDAAPLSTSARPAPAPPSWLPGSPRPAPTLPAAAR